MQNGLVKLAPSILAADFCRLGEQVAEAEQAGADRIHVDVMDGHFVPNLSMGAPIVQSLRRVTRLPLETHLMISDPDFFLDEFVEAGSDSFLVHWEGNNNLHRTVQRIKSLGKRAGVTINPATPAAVIEEILPDLDQVLVMTVNPGFGHQHFLQSTLSKIRRVSQMIEQAIRRARWKWMEALMKQLRRWQSRQERTCWWPGRRSLAQIKRWLSPWKGYGMQSHK
jgi:ribulose-phosphate 3-epimerase